MSEIPFELTPGLGVVMWRCLRCGSSGTASTDTAARFACYDHDRVCEEAGR